MKNTNFLFLIWLKFYINIYSRLVYNLKLEAISHCRLEYYIRLIFINSSKLYSYLINFLSKSSCFDILNYLFIIYFLMHFYKMTIVDTSMYKVNILNVENGIFKLNYSQHSMKK